MTDDIVTRLRERARQHQDDLLDLQSAKPNLLDEAADEIERLRRQIVKTWDEAADEIERLRGILNA